MSAKHTLTEAENAILIERFTPLAKKLVRKYEGCNEFLPEEDREQDACLGIIEAGVRYGKDVELPQVASAIRSKFRERWWQHLKNNPRSKCPECGSFAFKPCKHKRQLANEVLSRNVDYAFGKTNSLLVPIPDEDRDGRGGIPDTSSGSLDEKETEVWLDATVKAMPEDLQPLYQLKFVEKNSVAKISAATGLTKKEVEGRVKKAENFIRERYYSSATPNALPQSYWEILQAERPKVVLYIEPPAPPPLPRLSTLKACMYCHAPEHKWYEHRSPIERKKRRKVVVKRLPAFEPEESHEELEVLCGVGDDA
jgi:hypothetical protein